MRSSIPTSHGFQPITESDEMDETSIVAQVPGRFGELFKWAATIDQTPYLCVPSALRFRNDICGGEARIQDYCFNLAREGGRNIAKTLGTETMHASPDDSGNCCFTNVRLPLLFRGGQASLNPEVAHGSLDAADGPKVVKWIMDRLMCDFNTWIPGKFYAGAVWVRLSAQIYLEMKDFEWAAMVLQELCERVVKGEWCAQIDT